MKEKLLKGIEELKSENNINKEYDRALIELTAYCLGLNNQGDDIDKLSERFGVER